MNFAASKKSTYVERAWRSRKLNPRTGTKVAREDAVDAEVAAAVVGMEVAVVTAVVAVEITEAVGMAVTSQVVIISRMAMTPIMAAIVMATGMIITVRWELTLKLLQTMARKGVMVGDKMAIRDHTSRKGRYCIYFHGISFNLDDIF